jgi:cyclopropane-fatty-acyl-phospholipid synthase
MQRSWLNQLCKNAVLRQLQSLKGGELTLICGEETLRFGDRLSDLRATLHIHNDHFFRRIAFGGGLGAAESLMDGEWSCDDLAAMVRIFIRNSSISTGLDRGWAWLVQSFARIQYWLRSNNLTNARRNIREHYDLGNDFFRLFLDETLSYSSALFPDAHTSLHDASIAKLRHVCRKLDLQPRDHLLEIGTGWGGLALHAAENYGCRVTSTTISAEQHDLATQRIRAANLQDRVSIEQLDYRELQGKFDKLVSIEMIEAVGRKFLDTYFRQCSQLLRPDGVMVLQAIVIRDQLYERHSRSVDFIGKYIFPGGFLPSISAMTDSIARCTDLRVCHVEEMSSHYVRTLQAWRQRFWENIGEVRAQGFDDRFIRMWDYYFQYCEGAFAERQVNVVQMTLGKPEYLGSGQATQSASRVATVIIPRKRIAEQCVEGR